MSANPRVNIISTGSVGNVAEVNGDFLVDLGLSRNKFMASDKAKGVLRRISAVLITHEHKDHADPSLVKLLRETRPEVFKRQLFMPDATFRALSAANSAMHDYMMKEYPTQNIVCAGDVREFKTRSGIYRVEFFAAPHGTAECLSFVITTPDGKTIAWATDTERLDHLPKEQYDLLCIEGNWDTDLLAEALQEETTQRHANSSLRHSSVQAFEHFVKTHKKASSDIIQLHMSESFGVRSNLNTTDEV